MFLQAHGLAQTLTCASPCMPAPTPCIKQAAIEEQVHLRFGSKPEGNVDCVVLLLLLLLMAHVLQEACADIREVGLEAAATNFAAKSPSMCRSSQDVLPTMRPG